jgi:two-component system, cell cycle sensor histidine kinase PleC
MFRPRLGYRPALSFCEEPLLILGRIMNSDIIGSSRVLVIDDDPTSIELVKRLLTRAGFASIESTSEPAIALSLLRQVKPHVVLLDLHMPQIDGFGVLDLLRDEAQRVGCSIIMLTGDVGHDVQVEALKRGASDFVSKPFAGSVLVARIAGAAEMRELQRRLRDHNERLQEAVAARTQRLQAAFDVVTRAESELKLSLARSEAESSNRADVIARLAHELRTPLSAVCGFSEVMRGERFGPLSPRYLDYARDIHGAALHALEVINGFLDLAKAQAGEETLTITKVDVAGIIEESVRLLTPQAVAGSVNLKVKIKPGLGEIETDRTKLLQVVLNLTSNAVKFTPAGGTVTLEAGPDGEDGALIIIVRDTGIGIDAKDMDEVMRPFGQVGSAQDGRPKGTGLGLPLSREYVDLLGGSMSIVSRPGEGTVVTVRLPRRPPPRHAAAPSPAAAQ